ncbi:MAG: GNAT family N-acetyltransferase [Candidatus Helarchaeota archaeon]|nr:GNAT family N-acetyltransferase [Candidatus Helarchaeota archaeon]
MTIRNVQVKDKHAVTEVAENGAPLLRASVYGTYEFLARCFQRTFFVYLENSKIIGYIVGFPNTSVKEEFWLYQVGVIEKYRGRNIGSQLLKKLIDQVKSDGYKRIRSHFQFANEHSKNLHEKFGFKICGQNDEGLFGELVF